MTLAASGTMSLAGSTSTRSIALELGLSATATISLNDSAVRNLAGVASGAISISNFYGKSNQGSVLYSTGGTYTWVCPAGVTSISILAISAGGTGSSTYGAGLPGGGGGGLGWINNYAVTPGNSYTFRVGVTAGLSTLIFDIQNYISNGDSSGWGGIPQGPLWSGGGVGGRGGPNLGSAYGGPGGGAAGYGPDIATSSGGIGGGQNDIGGDGTYGGGGGGGGGDTYSYGGNGGGVGVYGQGSDGIGGGAGSDGGAGSGGSGKTYGGGGRGATYGGPGGIGGGGGAIRIVWPGTTRQFPSTNVSTA